jgi:hypothetical protein
MDYLIKTNFPKTHKTKTRCDALLWIFEDEGWCIEKIKPTKNSAGSFFEGLYSNSILSEEATDRPFTHIKTSLHFSFSHEIIWRILFSLWKEIAEWIGLCRTKGDHSLGMEIDFRFPVSSNKITKSRLKLAFRYLQNNTFRRKNKAQSLHTFPIPSRPL